MEIFLYAMIFVIGTFFGSFFTLAVYRIPKKEDILIKHSYCPNCHHKLGFFDLFPILSYLFLGGKCRYCKTKIRPRYLILELLSGCSFLFIALSLGENILEKTVLIDLAFLLAYISILFIVAGIDKENHNIQTNVIFFGYVVEIIYIIYQCTLGNSNVYQYVMYLIFLIAILGLSALSLRLTLTEKYYIQILYLSLYMVAFCGSKIYILSVIFTLCIIFIEQLLSQQKKKSLPVGFYLCISNVFVIIITNVFASYLM